MNRPVLEKSLFEIIGGSEDGDRDYQAISSLAGTALFSVFPERRALARQRLKEYFPGTPVKLRTEEDEHFVYSYVRFSGSPAYIFLEKYEKETPVSEDVPSPEEMQAWPSI